MTNSRQAPNDSASASIQTAAEAEKLIGHLTDVMGSLLALIEQETELVRPGPLGEAPRLEPKKTELARLYTAGAACVKANNAVLSRTVPRLLADLRRRHEEFQALLQINLAVLATAHAVSE